jgi:excisionase family DNA binding protein
MRSTKAPVAPLTLIVPDHVSVSGKLVSTGEAARMLGVNLRTLQRWASEGQIKPDWITPGGHMRWDVERLLREIKELPKEED